MFARPIYPDNPRTQMVNQFAGLDHNLVVRPGALYDMENMSTDCFPAIRTRYGRTLEQQLTKANGFGAMDDKLFWVDGTDFVFDGVVKGQVADSRKTFAKLGVYITIWPDKKYYNTATDEFADLGITWTGDVTFTRYTYDAEGEAAEVYQGNAIRSSTALPFEAGEAIVISGAKLASNNRVPIIREVLEDGKLLIFDNNVFTEDTTQPVTIKREIPDMDYFTQAGGRLFGCQGKKIYGSYLGVPWRWNNLGSLPVDSWATDTTTEGDFTGAANYGGYALFFKERCIHKLYGVKPSNYQALDSSSTGVMPGSSDSIATAGETLFYLGRNGVAAYNGGIPYEIGRELGIKIDEAVAGSDGRRLYLSARHGLDWTMYVYDTENRLWSKQDNVHAIAFAVRHGVLHYLDDQDRIWSIDTGSEDVDWMIETGDIEDNGPDKEQVVYLQARLELEHGEAHAYIQYDSDGKWEEAGDKIKKQVKGSVLLPIIAHRCDHFKIRLTGKGRCTIYSLTRTCRPGSRY